jgi:hypothetical protein
MPYIEPDLAAFESDHSPILLTDAERRAVATRSLIAADAREHERIRTPTRMWDQLAAWTERLAQDSSAVTPALALELKRIEADLTALLASTCSAAAFAAEMDRLEIRIAALPFLARGGEPHA